MLCEYDENETINGSLCYCQCLGLVSDNEVRMFWDADKSHHLNTANTFIDSVNNLLT